MKNYSRSISDGPTAGQHFSQHPAPTLPPGADLWPKYIADGNINSPLAILRHQASLLKEKTGGLLEGRVRTNSYDKYLVHNFQIFSPPIDYTYSLFSIKHDIDIYPVQFVHLDPAIIIKEGTEVDTENQFLETLKEVLHDNRTISVIQSIMSHAREQK